MRQLQLDQALREQRALLHRITKELSPIHLVSGYIQSAGKGTCYVCRAHKRSADEVVLDFQRDIDFEGALQVCGPCIAEAAKLTGAIADATEPLKAELALERERRETAEDEADRAIQALDAVRKAPAPRRKAPVEA